MSKDGVGVVQVEGIPGLGDDPTAGVSIVQARAPGPAPVRVAYERQGAGDSQLLLHVLGHHRQAWQRVVPLLAEGYDTITLDLPSFGQSPELGPAVPRNRVPIPTYRVPQIGINRN